MHGNRYGQNNRELSRVNRPGLTSANIFAFEGAGSIAMAYRPKPMGALKTVIRGKRHISGASYMTGAGYVNTYIALDSGEFE